jgi:hypothetical protein
MQKAVTVMIAGAAVAALGWAVVPLPASAATVATPAIHYGEKTTGLVQEVGKRKWKRGHYGHYRPYRHYGYYRPYRHYGYYRPYRHYGYYGRPYYRRPGVSLWFGF